MKLKVKEHNAAVSNSVYWVDVNIPEYIESISDAIQRNKALNDAASKALGKAVTVIEIK